MVPWSSGLDSTALVVYNLMAGNKVYAPYFEIVNNKDKAEMELKMRKGDA